MSQNGINAEVLEALAPNALSGRLRRNIKRIDSTEVQGAGSYVEIARVTWGEGKRLSAELEALNGDRTAQTAFTEKMITAHIVAWNWRAERDGELPLPKDDSTVLDELTGEEVSFLASAINGDADPKP